MRKCGSCTACCTTHSVHELAKGEWERCVNERKSGCAIYEDRPQSCRNFFCLWITGQMRANDRPDKSGLVVTCPRPGTINVREVWTGAAQSSKGRDVIASAREQGYRVEIAPKPLPMVT